jgi:hypothetical protein
LTTDLTTQLESQDWFVNMVSECKDIIVETEFTSRWSLVEGYHQLGARILTENENFERAQIYGQGICNTIAESLGKRPRTIYYAVQFARTYPDLNLLQEGKNCSWHHIINKYLTDGKEKPIKVSPSEQIKQIKAMLQTEWMKENQRVVSGEVAINKSNLDFIRYLQDQVEKITGNVIGS